MIAPGRAARSRPLLTSLTAATVAITLSAAPAPAAWREPVPGPAPVNVAPDRNAAGVSLATVGGVPHVAWTEDTTQPGQGNSSEVHVARLAPNGGSWQRVGGTSLINRRASGSTYHASLADVGGRPWVAWSENLSAGDKEIRVARPSTAGDSWQRVDDSDRPINHLGADPGGTADDPSIADASGRPFVAFWELDPGTGSLFDAAHLAPGAVWVVRLAADGSSWVPVGGRVNALADSDAAMPALAVGAGRPWVAYLQLAKIDGSPVLEIRVARLAADGSTWEQVGGALASGGMNAVERPSIAFVGGRPMVAAAIAGSVRVFVLGADGKAWEPVGSGTASASGVTAGGASIADVGGKPWVAWRHGEGQGASRGWVARLDGGTWLTTGGPAGDVGGRELRDGPVIASVNGFPWLAFTQGDGTDTSGQGCCTQVRVARLEPEFEETAAFPSATTATLLAATETFGLPYPVGFRYGLDGAAGAATSAAVPSTSVAFAAVGGLSPSALHWYEPFATAGTPEPRVVGTKRHFVTSSAAAPPATAATTARPRLLVAIVKAPTRVRPGARVRVKVLSTDGGVAVLRIRRGPNVAVRAQRTVVAGRWSIVWRAPRVVNRLYRVSVEVRAPDGRVARDSTAMRVRRAPARHRGSSTR